MSKKASKILSFAVIAVMLCGALSVGAAAANPIVIDFSEYDQVTDILSSAKGGDGEFDVVKDGGKFVLFAECVDGYDPGDDPDGAGTKGDLYSEVVGFADLNVDADSYQWMKISLKNESAAPGFEIHFSSPTKDYNVETSVTFDITPNSGYTSYVYNVTDACKKYYPKRPADVGDPNVYPDHWRGHINKLRLDFMYYEESGGRAKTGDKIYIEYIAFFDSEQAAKDFTFAPARSEEPPPAPAEAEPPPAAAEENDAGAAAPTDAPSSESESGGSTVAIIIIAVAAVAVIAVVVIIVMKGKGKK